MTKPNIPDDHKLRLMLLKEWHNKTDSKKAITEMIEEFGVDFILSTTVNYWYKSFDNGNIHWYKCPDNKSAPVISEELHVSSFQCGKQRTLHDVFLPITDEKQLSMSFFTNNGRYLIFYKHDSVPEERLIIIYDLFTGLKRTNLVPVRFSCNYFILIGDYLLTVKRVDEMYTIFALKICYEDLSFEEIEERGCENFWAFAYDIIQDQLDTHRFILCDKDFENSNIVIGQIQNDEIVVEDVETFEGFYMTGIRLAGNLIQGFDFGDADDPITCKFREFNLDTKEVEETDVPIVSAFNDLFFENNFTFDDCWSNDRFYAMFKMQNHQHQLFMFDPKILKWFDVKIFVNKPSEFYIDSNEIMSLSVGTKYKLNALYRIALRTPDSLMNLARLTAVRESTVFGNDIYINAARRIKFVE